jgi:hypothetical protein
MPTTPATHATHDELLLARLYGGDVDERESGQALDQIASCRECSDLFADFGAIATATAALPIPPRPRDFKLTEADAARVGRRSAVWSIFDRLGRTRAFGGAMMTAGLVGVVFVGALSVFAPGGSAGTAGTPLTVAAPVAGASSPGHELSGQKNGGDTAIATTAPNQVPAASAAPATAGATSASAATAASAPTAASAATAAATDQGPLPAATSGDRGPAPVPTAQPASSGEAAFGPDADGQGAYGVPTAAPPVGSVGDTLTGNGPDARQVAFAAFAGIGILGLLLLTMPRLASRRRGR